MIKINIVGEIGWDVYAFDIDFQLKEANGEDIEFLFNTPGGFVSEGNTIDELILNYKKDFPKAQIMATIIEAQSYGSYLLTNPAFDMIVARTNSVVMIHNPLMGVIGDYKELRKNADILERKAAMFAERYIQKMNKPVAEMRKMMDGETYFIGGNEIVESGIADEMISDKELLKEKTVLRAKAETKMESLKIKIKNTESDFEKIAAMVKDKDNEKKKKELLSALEYDEEKVEEGIRRANLESKQPAKSGENNQEVIKLKNKDELQVEFPVIHAEVMKAGEDKGREEIIANNKAIMDFKNKEEYKNLEFVQLRCEKAIEDGEDISDLKMSITALMLDPTNQASIESPESISMVKKVDSVSGEEMTKDEKMKADEAEKENGEW